MKEDYASIQAAGKKRSLWGSIGATLLGGAAVAATGGAAAPLVAGAMAAGGSFAGGHIGNWLAGKTKGGKLTGRKWYGSLGKGLGSQIKEGINARALKSGLQATLMGAGGKVGSKLLGKGGAATKDTNLLTSLFKGGDKGGQTGIKGLIDFEGSALYGGMNKLGSMMDTKKINKLQAGEGLVPTGQGDMIGTGKLPSGDGGVPDLDKMFADELNLPATDATDDLDVLLAKANQTENISSGNIRGQNQWVTPNTTKSAKTKLLEEHLDFDSTAYTQNILDRFGSDSLQNTISKAEAGPSMTGPNPKIYGQSAGEANRYNVINKMEDAGYSVSPGGGLPEEFGRGYVGDKGQIVRPPSRPDVPYLDPDADDFDFFTGEQPTVSVSAPRMSGLSEFDEAAWAEGEDVLSRINAQKVNKLQSSSRYYEPRNNRYKSLFGR